MNVDIMNAQGRLSKFQIKHTDQASYMLYLGSDAFNLSDVVGKQLSIQFQGEIMCGVCHELTPKSYQGNCFNCFNLLAMNDRCVLQPHLCHFAKGTCREPAWGMLHCMQPHLVYLAWTSDLKVGITKPQNIPSRWLDQGALAAKVICQTQSRYHAGLIEHYLHQWFSDRTQWQTMLKVKNTPDDLDLNEAYEVAKSYILDAEFDFINTVMFIDDPVLTLQYPMPESGVIKSLSLDKTPSIAGRIMGMKGQYLYLDNGVLNIRKHNGYKVVVKLD
ncbi:DUF2797 domain-containing protein [Gammaproteobacteria bacterium]|nr:DUF2797 domain-containing protein [Gammaproteobacteria bacterium]